MDNINKCVVGNSNNGNDDLAIISRTVIPSPVTITTLQLEVPYDLKHFIREKLQSPLINIDDIEIKPIQVIVTQSYKYATK